MADTQAATVRAILHSLLLSVALVSCATKSPQAVADEAEFLLKNKNVDLALAAAERGLLAFPEPTVAEHWRLRVVKYNCLRLVEEPEKSRAALEPMPPPAVARTEAGAQYRLTRVRILGKEAAGEDIDGVVAEAQSAGLHQIVRYQRAQLARGEAAYRIREEARIAGDWRTFAYLSGNLGLDEAERFRLDVAVRMTEEAREGFERVRDLAEAARADINMGWLYELLGREDQALEFKNRSVEAFTKLGYRAEVRLALRNLGAHYLDLHQYDKAKEHFDRAAALLQPKSSKGEVAAVWSDVALAALGSGRYDEASLALDKAVANLDPKQPIYEYSEILISRGRLAEVRGGKGDPLELYRQALAMPGVNHTSPLEARLRIAKLYRRQGYLAEAEREYREALRGVAELKGKLSQEDSKMAFVSTLIRVYQDYVDLLVETGRDREALLLVDESRLQVFTERAGEAGRKSWPALQLDRLTVMLRASRTTALVYWLAPKRSFLWVVNGEGARRLPDLESSTTLEPLVRAHVEQVRASEDPLKDSNTELATKLALGHAKGRVIIVPDGGLHWLNFETLPIDGNRYWIENATVSIAPSLRILTQEAPSPSGPALLVGDAATSPGYERLKHAARELRAIESAYAKRTVLEGADATPQAYAAAKPGAFRDIHFAAHAEPNSRSPLDSAVILSPGVGGGTRLSARDILLHPLRARLVTLSACSAAGARSYGGEGLVGFAWAFLRAGADRVVAGLWKVDDESTSELMAKFHRELRTRPPAEALREAKLSLLRQTGAFRKPYYWGPFQVYTAVVDP